MITTIHPQFNSRTLHSPDSLDRADRVPAVQGRGCHCRPRLLGRREEAAREAVSASAIVATAVIYSVLFYYVKSLNRLITMGQVC